MGWRGFVSIGRGPLRLNLWRRGASVSTRVGPAWVSTSGRVSTRVGGVYAAAVPRRGGTGRGRSRVAPHTGRARIVR